MCSVFPHVMQATTLGDVSQFFLYLFINFYVYFLTHRNWIQRRQGREGVKNSGHIFFSILASKSTILDYFHQNLAQSEQES